MEQQMDHQQQQHDDSQPTSSSQFKPARIYFGHTCSFLKKAITVKFDNPVTIKTCRIGYLLKDISDDDLSALDAVLSEMSLTVAIDPEAFFIKKINKWMLFNSQGHRIRNLPDETQAMVELKILGCKMSSSGKSTPMLEIQKATECVMEFADD